MPFTDSKTQVSVIEPAWTKSNATDEAECQTDNISFLEHAVQTRRVRDVEISTDSSGVGGQADDEEGDQAVHVDERGLQKFLKRVEPLIIKTLVANSNSRAFLVTDEEFEVVSSNQLITCEYQLHQVSADALSVVALTWNSTGAVLAAALSHTQHDQWCAHRGQIVTWNIRRSKVQKDKADATFDTESCIACLSYHPHEPSWLAVGCFSGQLLIYDTSNIDDPVYLKSASNKAGTSTVGLAGAKTLFSHVDAITQVRWTRGSDLLTVGADGRLILWKVRKPKRLLEPVKGFLLSVENLPRSLRPKVTGTEAFALRRRQIAISDVSVSALDSELCVLASDCGCVFRCDLEASADLPTIDVGETQLHSLQSIAYKSCQSPVTHVHCSPFHRNLIAASASNGMLLFYDSVNTSWLRSVDSGEGVLNAMEFSPSRASVLVAVGNRGNLLVYDLHDNQHSPVVRVNVGENSSDSSSATSQAAAPSSGNDKNAIAAICVSFNSKDPSLLATGDSSGSICVWKLANELLVGKADEIQILATRILNSAE